MVDMFTVGWREWVGLPDLGLSQIKAKVDTGARTSALHAFKVRPFFENGTQRVEFQLNPHQHETAAIIICTADIIDQRTVRDSGGHQEERWVISTQLIIGKHSWPIELTLTARNDMRFRMLLGRNALKHRALVNSAGSYLVGKKLKKIDTQGASEE